MTCSTPHKFTNLALLLIFILHTILKSNFAYADKSHWIPEIYNQLKFTPTPPTINEDETEWVISADGKFALSIGANIILWDVALASPLIVYHGHPSAVRFSEYSPNLVYMRETEEWWILKDLYTDKALGMFKEADIPPQNIKTVPTEFLKKIYSHNLSLEFTDMDVDNSGSRILLGGPLPMIWDLEQAQLAGFVEYTNINWLSSLKDRNLTVRSPKYSLIEDNTLPMYWTIRCTFGSDSTMYISLPGNGMHIFDWNGNYIKSINYAGVITQLRSYKNNIIAEQIDESPLIYINGDDSFSYIKSRSGNKLPFDIISEISEDGYFLGASNSNHIKFTIGQLRQDGTAKWSPMKLNGSFGSPLKRLYMSKSGNRLSFTREFDNILKLYYVKYDNEVFPDYCLNLPIDLTRSVSPFCGKYISDSIFAVGSAYGEMYICKEGNYTVMNENDLSSEMLYHQGAVIAIDTINSSCFASADSYGTIRIWNTNNFELIATMMYFPPEDYIIYTPDNFYKATKGATDRIFYTKGLDSYTFRQFDLKYNRPDIILERLGGNKKKISILHSAWEKRLKRMGFNKDNVMSAQSHAPKLEISNRSVLSGTILDSSTKDTVTLNIRAYDSATSLKSLHILINGVPIFGTEGRKITSGDTYNEAIQVCLSEGSNLITVYCLNEYGQESLQQQVAIENRAQTVHRTLYVAAIGVSNYLDNSRNLQYATNDATSFAEYVKKDNDKFSYVKSLILKDSCFDKNSLSELRDFFSQAKRNDVAILYYAGHGILDNSLNYYIGCTSADFTNPEKTAIRYDDFQDVLDKTPSLHRYCIIDACHSGDIDKDESLAINTISSKEYGELKFRSAGRRVLSTTNKEIAQQYHSMFVDLSQKSGITVVASSNGNELSVESPIYGGGLFTHMLIEGLSGKCDTNKDGNITANELLEFVKEKVGYISNGMQNPQIKYHERDKETVLK